MDHLSSARLSTAAIDYFEAGVIVARAKKDHSYPAYFLFAQGIELAFKSYLRAQKYSKDTLRKLSHDLPFALKKARDEGLDALLPISASDSRLVRDLGVHYKSRDLQYTELGGKRRFPPVADVEDFARRLIVAIRPFAIKNLKVHYGKSTEVR